MNYEFFKKKLIRVIRILKMMGCPDLSSSTLDTQTP